MPLSDKPFSWRISDKARALPDDPTASFQWPFEKPVDHGLQFMARREFGLLHRTLADLAIGKILEAVAHAAHVKAVQAQRLQRAADDEFGRAAADVDDQALVLGHGQTVRDADIDEARFLAAGDDFDRETERRFSLFQKCRRILGHAQRVGADGTHAMRIETAQAFAEALQAFERTLLRIFVEPFLAVKPAPRRIGSRSESRG